MYSGEESEAEQLNLDQFDAAVAHMAECPAWVSILHLQCCFKDEFLCVCALISENKKEQDEFVFSSLSL